MSAFAMFSLKSPSLLAFDDERKEGNLQRVYGIGQVPCDTACAKSSTRLSRSPCDRCSSRSLGLCNAVKPWKRWSLSTATTS